MYNRMSNFVGPMANFAPVSNKIVVKSLEDALRRYSDFNSEMLYIDAHKNLIYNVFTDSRGEKSYDVYEIKKVEQKSGTPDNAILETLMTQLAELNKKVENLYEQRTDEQKK